MKRDGLSVSVDLEYDDNYDEVIKKASQTLQLGSVNSLRLFKLRGALIRRNDDWCIGDYKRSLHYGSDAIELGLGYLRKAMDPTSVCYVRNL